MLGGAGYYSRARNIKKAAEILTEKYNGSFPESYGEILALPGIGSYTAGAIASIAFELPGAGGGRQCTEGAVPGDREL